MAPRPIIIFDTVPRVRLSGSFKLGVVSYFADQLGGLSGIVLTATDGTTSITQTKNSNTLRTEFYDVGSHNGTSYSTYSGYSNPNFYYSGWPIPAWGYQFSLNTSSFLGASPYINVVATAYPNNNSYDSRSISGYWIKDSLVSKPIIWVDPAVGVNDTGRGSEALPYQSIAGAMGYASDAGNIDLSNLQMYLKSGNYDYLSNPVINWPWAEFFSSSGWVDIQPAPGVSRSSVVINESANGWTPRPNQTQHLHFKNITFSGIAMFAAIASNQQTYLWQDNCFVKGGEVAALNNIDVMAGNVNFVYLTNTHYRYVMNGPGWGSLTRDCLVQNYVQAGYRMIGAGYPLNENSTEKLLLNCQAVSQYAFGSEVPHPDVIHLDFLSESGAWAENVAVQGLRATDISNSQAIFAPATRHKDIAFVNMIIESGNSRFGGGADHLIMRNCTFPSGTLLWQPSQMYAGPYRHHENCEFTSNIFTSMGPESGTSTAFIDHFEESSRKNLFSHNAFHLPGEWTGLGVSYRTGIIEYNSGQDKDYRAYPMLGNSIFGIGFVPSGWNSAATEVITHLQAEPMIWAFAGAFAPLFPDLGAWYQTANDPRGDAPSLSADCIISPGGCRRNGAGQPIRGSSATRAFINILRPTGMSNQEYEQLLNNFINMLINALINNRR